MCLKINQITTQLWEFCPPCVHWGKQQKKSVFNQNRLVVFLISPPLTSGDNPLGINQGCQVFLLFSLFGSHTTVSSRKQLSLMGLCHWLPRSRLQIWGSGLSAKELRAPGTQAADRCNMLSVRVARAPGWHGHTALSPRVTNRLQHLFSLRRNASF